MVQEDIGGFKWFKLFVYQNSEKKLVRSLLGFQGSMIYIKNIFLLGYFYRISC